MKFSSTIVAALLSIGIAVGQHRLDSPDWTERYQAFASLSSAQTPLDAAGKRKLDQLLRLETKVILDTLNASNGKTGVSDTFGEEFGEYYSRVLDRVFEFAKVDEDEDALHALAAGAYDPRSIFATELVKRWWKVIAPVFLDVRPEDGAGIAFGDALEMMGRILGAHRAEMPQQMISQMEDRLMQGLLHPDYIIRQSACEAAGDAGFKAAIPVLRRLSKEDPVSLQDRFGKTYYPRREVAAKALQKLEK